MSPTILYSPESVKAHRGRARRAGRAALLTALGALAVCIALCFGITTRNAGLRQGLVIALSALAGWAAVLLTENGMITARREAAHEEGVLREEETVCAGPVKAVGKPFQIPKSIAFVPVTVETEDGETELKLNARFRKTFPGAGRKVRLRVRRGYITAWEAEEAGRETLRPDRQGKPAGKGEKTGKAGRILRMLHRGVLCLLACGVLWSWIFTFLTDTGRENKIVLYADMKNFQWQELAVFLEEAAPEGIRFVQVHPFTYAMMNSAGPEQADLYIMTVAQAAEFERLISPWPETPEDLPPELAPLVRDVPPVPSAPAEGGAEGAQEKTFRGLLLYDAETGEGIRPDWLNYGDQPGENWYLFFGIQSLHVPGNENSVDGAAIETARILLCR